MKKITQKIAFILFSAIFMVAVSSVTTAFAADKTMTVKLRIEGIEKNLFYATEEVPYTDTLTLQQALTYIDKQEDSIKITGVDTAYITDINGEAAAKFGGWDGWLYKVNGKDSALSINSLELKDGDSVVLYYGDPYGVGMQFPVADTSDLKDGVIKFTSSDTSYDASGNAVTKVNPVAGATVTWSDGDTTKEYVTDKKGSINVDADLLTDGAHAVQISKTGDTKLPLVLRFAPDYTITTGAANDTNSTDATADSTKSTVTVTKNSDSTASDVTASDKTSSASASSDTVKATDNSAPKTGEKLTGIIILGILSVISLCGVILFRRKDSYEK